MYTAEDVDALRDRLAAEGASKAEIVKRMAWACVGWPYVFGAQGEMCTPDVREKYAGYHPEHRAAIYNACPWLSSEGKSTCDTCKWVHARCFDCRGFTRWLLAQVGLDLYGGGATTQWEKDSNWAATGDILDLSEDLVCCVFKRRNGKMTHTGVHVGGFEIVHCSGEVKPGNLSDRPVWSHWGVPAGLYSTEELRKAGLDVTEARNKPTLHSGAQGETVKWLQLMLNEENGAGLDVDGVYGRKTVSAVKDFQRAHGLTVDGICGPKTWAMLEACANDAPMEGPVGDPEEWDPPETDDPEPNAGTLPEEPEKPPDTVTIARADWMTIKAAAATLIAAVKNYE